MRIKEAITESRFVRLIRAVIALRNLDPTVEALPEDFEQAADINPWLRKPETETMSLLSRQSSEQPPANTPQA